MGQRLMCPFLARKGLSARHIHNEHVPVLGLDVATDHEQVSLRPDQEPPQRPGHRFGDRKIMVSIALYPLGFHLLEALPMGRVRNAEYDRDNIVAALIQFVPELGGRQPVIHADTVLNNVEPFVRKLGCDSLRIRPPHLISHLRMSSYSAMSRTTCRESSFNQRENYSGEGGRYWTTCGSRLCSAPSSTGWRDSMGFSEL
jgi:hypothetical protein